MVWTSGVVAAVAGCMPPNIETTLKSRVAREGMKFMKILIMHAKHAIAKLSSI
ncbi:hypothetical protein CPter291_5303 [Collimonas pratensis]|uniref:Lipoprotein n=1 Tax=Collimonas pratensis TaxID=279113 RepID=A0ABN4MK51_9BURK|nr:hypothetical protein CPter291_5303 [Collimonas pratensis]